MNDETYSELSSSVSRDHLEHLAELEAEARRREDRATLLAIELVRGPDEKSARARGDRLALGRAIISRGRSSHTWQKLVSEVGRWPDDDASRDIVAQLAQVLDAVWPDLFRLAPAAWWNAAQSGDLPLGWPLVRALRLRLDNLRERFEPCRNPLALDTLGFLLADDDYLDPDQLAAAGNLRELHYRFDRPPGSLAVLAMLPRLEVLELVFSRACTAAGIDLGPLAGVSPLRELELDFESNAPVGADLLSPLAGCRLRRLKIVGPDRLESLDVLRRLPDLQVLQLGHAPSDLGPIAGLAKLRQLELYSLESWPDGFTLPAGITKLSVSEAPGLRSTKALAGARELQRLVLSDCSDLVELDLSYFPALRQLNTGAVPVEVIVGLSEAPGLCELFVSDMPTLRRIEIPEGELGLERLVAYDCPALTDLDELRRRGVEVVTR